MASGRGCASWSLHPAGRWRMRCCVPSRGWMAPPRRRGEGDASLETAYCAEIIAVTYQAMGLLPDDRRPDWYDAGRFWSGDDLRLCGEARLSGEIAVQIPATQLSATS